VRLQTQLAEQQGIQPLKLIEGFSMDGLVTVDESMTITDVNDAILPDGGATAASLVQHSSIFTDLNSLRACG